jgi:hypothetical protein
MEKAGEQVLVISYNTKTTKLSRIGTSMGQNFAACHPELANQFMQFMAGNVAVLILMELTLAVGS